MKLVCDDISVATPRTDKMPSTVWVTEMYLCHGFEPHRNGSCYTFHHKEGVEYTHHSIVTAKDTRIAELEAEVRKLRVLVLNHRNKRNKELHYLHDHQSIYGQTLKETIDFCNEALGETK